MILALLAIVNFQYMMWMNYLAEGFLMTFAIIAAHLMVKNAANKARFRHENMSKYERYAYYNHG